MKLLLFCIFIAFSLATTGALPSKNSVPIKTITYKGNNDDLPENFNPIEKWPMCKSLLDIRDQATCGGCWAFSAVEAATDRLCIHSNGTHTEPLSTEDVISCCPYCGLGCKGGWADLAWGYMEDGVVTGNEYGDNSWCRPYSFPKCDHHINGTYGPCGNTQPTPECIGECSSEYGVDYSKDKHYFNKTYRIASDEQTIMRELYENGPISVNYEVYEDFATYKSGIYQHVTGEYLGGHAVKMIGWGIENGVKYWTIANSWNNEWGENGFFRIIRGINDCGIELQGYAAIPKL